MSMLASSSLSLAFVLATFVAQNVPPELRRNQQRGFDPVLPEIIRPAVERASKAELDPKRGAGNAVEILKAERKKFQGAQDIQLAIDVRVAATMLRSRFATNEKVTEPERLQQALSTFSKLDMSEPGLKEWTERAIALLPEVKAELSKPKASSRSL